MNITGSGSTNVAIVKKLLTRKKSWNTTLLSILKLVLRLCLCHHYPNPQVSNNDSYLIYLKILCFTVSLFIGGQPKLFSGQPKPGIGIGNWNQCPISVRISNRTNPFFGQIFFSYFSPFFRLLFHFLGGYKFWKALIFGIKFYFRGPFMMEKIPNTQWPAQSGKLPTQV